jgi:hypothetical protein
VGFYWSGAYRHFSTCKGRGKLPLILKRGSTSRPTASGRTRTTTCSPTARSSGASTRTARPVRRLSFAGSGQSPRSRRRRCPTGRMDTPRRAKRRWRSFGRRGWWFQAQRETALDRRCTKHDMVGDATKCLGDPNMRVLLATIAVLTVLTAPTVVRAQVNYELLAGYGQGGRHFARVISFQDNKVYNCSASTDPKVAPALSCTALPGNYTLLNGNNVKTVQTRSNYNTTGP